MKKTTVEIPQGKVILKEPRAKERNKAAIAAWKDGSVNEPLMVTKLLPLCILEHPFGNNPVTPSLEDLPCTEYDKLSKAMQKLLRPPEDTEKKLEQPSTPEESTTAG